MGVDLHPVDNPLKTGMATPAKWDVNSPNPGLELPKLGIRTPTTQDDNSPTRPVENPKIPCIYWAESVFKKSAPIIYWGTDDDDVMKSNALLDTLNPERIL